MPGVLLVDLYNTLVPGGDVHRTEMLRGMAADLGVDPDEFRKIVYTTWPERMKGIHGDLVTETSSLVTRLGASPSPSAVRTAVERRLAFARRQLVPSATAVDTMITLREQGWRVAIVSNCSFDSAAALRLTPLATAVEVLVLSCEVHLGKPDPAIYRMACSALGEADPAACVFVGDGADGELDGATALGMRVIQTLEYFHTAPTWQGEQINTIASLLTVL